MSRLRPSASMVVASCALVVAAAGVGTAATGVIDGAHIKNGSISGAKLANRTVTGAKIAHGAISDTQLAAGAGFPSFLPAGKTVAGDFYLPGNNTTTPIGTAISWYWPLRTFPSVVFTYYPYTTRSVCTGTASNPTAPKGTLCVYVDEFPESNTLTWGQVGRSKSGILLGSPDGAADGTWAVTGN